MQLRTDIQVCPVFPRASQGRQTGLSIGPCPAHGRHVHLFTCSSWLTLTDTGLSVSPRAAQGWQRQRGLSIGRPASQCWQAGLSFGPCAAQGWQTGLLVGPHATQGWQTGLSFSPCAAKCWLTGLSVCPRAGEGWQTGLSFGPLAAQGWQTCLLA